MKHKHFELKDFNKDNWHLLKEKPDPGFSPERNYAVIRGTIEEYEKMRFGIDPKVSQAAGDRADILASWAKYKLDFGGEKQIEGWLGREHFNRIAGQGIIQKIKMMESMDKLSKLQHKYRGKTMPKGIQL